LEQTYPIPIAHPTNLALFGHKITLYRFNHGAHTIAGGSNRSRGAEPHGPLTLTTADGPDLRGLMMLKTVPRWTATGKITRAADD